MTDMKMIIIKRKIKKIKKKREKEIDRQVENDKCRSIGLGLLHGV